MGKPLCLDLLSLAVFIRLLLPLRLVLIRLLWGFLLLLLPLLPTMLLLLLLLLACCSCCLYCSWPTAVAASVAASAVSAANTSAVAASVAASAVSVSAAIFASVAVSSAGVAYRSQYAFSTICANLSGIFFNCNAFIFKSYVKEDTIVSPRSSDHNGMVV